MLTVMLLTVGISLTLIGFNNMKCQITEINRDGEKVAINTCDFNSETMTLWDHPHSKVTNEPEDGPKPKANPKSKPPKPKKLG